MLTTWMNSLILKEVWRAHVICFHLYNILEYKFSKASRSVVAKEGFERKERLERTGGNSRVLEMFIILSWE